jgi:hypothetical protein
LQWRSDDVLNLCGELAVELRDHMAEFCYLVADLAKLNCASAWANHKVGCVPSVFFILRRGHRKRGCQCRYAVRDNHVNVTKPLKGLGLFTLIQ